MTNKEITVIGIMDGEIVHIKDVEKDSADAFWQVGVKYLEGISRTPKQKTIVVKEIAKTLIKTGRYKKIDVLNGLPVYEMKIA